MVTVGENNKMLKNEPLMMTRTLYHSTLEGAQLQEQTTLQELQQKTDNIKKNEELTVTQAENNTLKIQLHEIMHKMKLQMEWHTQEALELYENLIRARKENEELVLEIILMEEKFHQTSKEAKELQVQISFLQQKMQHCDKPLQIQHDTAVSTEKLPFNKMMVEMQ
jgi:hypothetical protein